jgi:adenosylhomocysteine nucleosidase
LAARVTKSAAPFPDWLCVVGLEAEAQIARLLTPQVVIGSLRFSARPAVILSFGLAGGLDPALRPGTIIVPAAVLAGGVKLAARADLLGGATHDLLLAADKIVADADGKRALWCETGACAVDMESGAAAAAAMAEKIPFVVLRAICDPAERSLPPAAMIALDGRGVIMLGRVLGSIVEKPGQIPALIALARDAARARRALLDRVGDLCRRGVA